MPKISQVTKRAHARSIVAGLEKRFPAGKVQVAGVVYSRKELVATFQAHLDALDELDAAHAQLAAAARAERDAAKRASTLALQLKQIVPMREGASPVALGDFGWDVPKKPGPKTAAAKLAGVVKGRATREARKRARST